MVRPADPLDGATPSGASSIAEALQLAAHLVPASRGRAVRVGGRRRRWRGARRCWRERRARAGTGWRWPRPPCAGRIQIAVACDACRLGAAGCGARAGARRRGRRRRRRWTRRSCWPAATGSAAPTPPTCAAAACATCRSRPPRNSLPRWACPCSVRHMPSPTDQRQDRQPLPRARRARATSTTSSSCTPRTPPSRIRSAARCTSAARRSTASTRRSPAATSETEMITLRVARPRGGVLLGAHHRARRQPDAHRDHQRR